MNIIFTIKMTYLTLLMLPESLEYHCYDEPVRNLLICITNQNMFQQNLINLLHPLLKEVLNIEKKLERRLNVVHFWKF